jgi:hypothetical protein
MEQRVLETLGGADFYTVLPKLYKERHSLSQKKQSTKELIIQQQ